MNADSMTTDIIRAAGEREMTAPEYFAGPGLSNSGMRDLEVSPLRYWHLHVNPERPEPEPKDCFDIGSALHCAVLEPQEFHSRYVGELDQADFPGCLVTISDARQWLKDKGHTPKGTLKADILAQVVAVDPTQVIWDKAVEDHCLAHADKTILSISEYNRVENMATVLCSEPRLAEILKTGRPEHCVFRKCPKHGIPRKARLDWVSDEWIVDLKTFTQKRGKSIEKTIADAIYYERYYRQARFYVDVERESRSFKDSKNAKSKRFLMAFIESEEPHDVRLFELGPKSQDGGMNLFWQRAGIEIDTLSWTYKQYSEKYGERPWISEQRIEPLEDQHIKQLAWD